MEAAPTPASSHSTPSTRSTVPCVDSRDDAAALLLQAAMGGASLHAFVEGAPPTPHAGGGVRAAGLSIPSCLSHLFHSSPSSSVAPPPFPRRTAAVAVAASPPTLPVCPPDDDSGVAALLLGFGAHPRKEEPPEEESELEEGDEDLAPEDATDGSVCSEAGVAAHDEEAPASARDHDDDVGDERYGGGDDDDEADAVEAMLERQRALPDAIDLCGASPREAVGSRLQVSYMERQGKNLVAVPYRGSVVSVDLKKGLRVKLDGYKRREWVTDEDEWVWLSADDQAPLPHQMELLQSSSTDAKKPSKSTAAPPATPLSVVRVRLCGLPPLELPSSGAKSPRRASSARPLPHGMEPRAAPRAEKGEGEVKGEVGDPLLTWSARDAAQQTLVVTIAAGPHLGKEARVLHVGNGWVKLQLPSGNVVHMRKWDLRGDVPLKMRSSPSKPRVEAAPAVAVEAEAPAAAPKGRRNPLEEAREREEMKQRSPDEVGEEANEPNPPAEADDVGEAREEQRQSDGENGETTRPASSKPEARDVHAEASGKENGGKCWKKGATSEESAENSDAKESKTVKRQGSRKRSFEPLAEGFHVGAQVWARWSGIKFSHGVISKLLTSSKWIMVTFDNDTSQWVTVRDIVIDTKPEPHAVCEGVECIAAWEEDTCFYKGKIIGTSYKGRFKVRFDDWDEQLVDLDGIRLLPADFGKKKRCKEGVKNGEEAGEAEEARADEVMEASRKPPLDTCGAAGGSELSASTHLAGLALRMAAFVQQAKEALAHDDARFHRLSELLDRMGAGCAAVEDDVRVLLREHPQLLANLEAVLSNVGSGPDADWEGKREEGMSSANSSCSCREESALAERVDEQAAVSSEAESEAAEASALGAGVHDALRGPQGKGVRELHKLLHDFGDGSTIGVEIGSKTRQRACAPNSVDMAPPGQMPFKKRSKQREGGGLMSR